MMQTIAKTQSATKGTATEWARRTLAAGVLMAALVVAGGLQASPAQAADTFTVTRTVDTPDANVGDGKCDASLATTDFECTLRAAIQEANATTETDLIRFAILDGGTGVQTIEVGKAGFGALPAITHPVVIDGYTQHGASPNTRAVGNDAVLKIELNGTSAPPFTNGLELSSASNSSIRGLVVNRFYAGIRIQGDSVGNRIGGNFIGTDPSGTIDQGNTDRGVDILNGPSENVVGGTTPAARNVISGNTFDGIFLSNSDRNRIEGNYIGTDKGGTKALGNGFAAVALSGDSSGNTVGGTMAGARNVISGNDLEGVVISSRDTKVLGNRIGTTANGTGALGNGFNGLLIEGPNISVGDGTTAGSNTVAFNGRDGVRIQANSSVGNAISRNSIFSNAELGIDLDGSVEDASGNTPNDGDDPATSQPDPDKDVGPNTLQNKPALSSAKTSATKTTVAGKLNSTPNKTFTIRFFSNPPGGDEGKVFVGQKRVSTNASGNVSFTKALPKVAVGRTITATATGPGGNTSEFSAPRKVAAS